MNKLSGVRILLIILFISILLPKNQIYCQTKSELQNRKKKLQDEISLTNKLLNDIQEKEKNSIEEYNLKNEKISLQSNYIHEINEQINLIGIHISNNEKNIDSLNTELSVIRKEYGKLIYIAYKNRYTGNPIMFILAADNLNQAYKRIKYIQEYSEYRKNEVKKIEVLISEISFKSNELKSNKQKKINLLVDVKREKSSLQKDIDEKKQLIRQLKKKETSIKQDLLEKKRIADKLEKEIENLIKVEMSKGSSNNYYNRLTPEEKIISSNFSANMGKLPWPTQQGVITGRFGTHPHPVVKGVIINNHGIDITTIKNAEVRCIFDGVVSRILTIMGSSYTVIVRHGNYLSVYHNLSEVNVRQGQIVKMKQIIGRVKNEPNSNAAVLHVELWKEQEILNPEKWLAN